MAAQLQISGEGVAARACARLCAAGFRPARASSARQVVPAIMLGDQAVALIRDIFNAPAAFSTFPKIARRIVAWGAADPVTLDHSGVVVTESELLETMAVPEKPATANFTIHCENPLPLPQKRVFGNRTATIARVSLREPAAGACRIESLPEGWLFLIPNEREHTWLLSIGSATDAQLAQSSLIAPLIDTIDPRPGEFPTAPRIAEHLGGDAWLACGTAALAFDPICGDGTAQAIREAILASAVARAILNGGDPKPLLAHYETRLIAGMHRHLFMCVPFYESGGKTDWWKSQLAALHDGLAWCRERLERAAPPRYALRGFELTTIE